MPPIPKGAKISEIGCRAVLDDVRAGLRGVLRVRREPENRGEIRPHHVRPVYPEQNRRSNPLVVPLYDSEHEWLHANPKVEEKIRIPLLLKALECLARGNIEVIEVAVRAAIEHIAQKERD